MTAGPVASDWWASFGDPILSELENRALADNLDLQTAAARVAGSRAQLRIAGASGLPNASAGASYFRERASPKGIQSLLGADGLPPDAASGTVPQGATGRPGSASSPSYDLFQVGFDSSWELDLWGKVRRTREAARADQRLIRKGCCALRATPCRSACRRRKPSCARRRRAGIIWKASRWRPCSGPQRSPGERRTPGLPRIQVTAARVPAQRDRSQRPQVARLAVHG